MPTSAYPSLLTCKHCGREFEKTGKRGPAPTYCSGTCKAAACTERAKADGRFDEWEANAADKRRVERRDKLEHCPFCGNLMDRVGRVQCGKPECRRAWQNERCREWQRNNRAKANSYRPRYARTCVECGASFETGKKQAKYCSTGAGSCEATSRSREYIERGFGQERKDEAEQRRRSRILQSFTEEPTKRELAAFRRVLRHDPCAYCGERPSGLDHIDHKAGDGTDDWTNLTGCCKRCNELKTTLPLLLALPWIPIARDYHAERRRLFAA